MADWKFGDLICYKIGPGEVHDDPLIYVGICGHDVDGPGITRTKHLIDILDVSHKYTEELEHKAPDFWQRCTHIAAGDVQVR